MSSPLIVGIGGTMRPASSSERALVTALQAAESAGASTLLFGADALNLPMYAPELGGRTAEAEALVAAIARADGIIVASPGYHGAVSGLVKNALDYVEDLREADRPYLEGRAVGCIACAGGWQASITTLVGLRTIVHALRGWPTPLGVAINSLDPAPRSDDQLAILGRQVVEFANARVPA
jgi:FMN reductase